MNDSFCDISKKLIGGIPQQPYLISSNDYEINEEGTSLQFRTVYIVSDEEALIENDDIVWLCF